MSDTDLKADIEYYFKKKIQKIMAKKDLFKVI